MESGLRFGHYQQKWALMKSMTMVDFFIENKGKLQLKQQDIINHTNVGKGDKLWSIICENGSIMKSLAMELSSHIISLPMESRPRFGHYICENRSIMKSMAMVDFFIENKGTFFPYHYITNGNRHALVRICENGSIMKSMAMVDFFIENKGTFFPYHYITYGNRHALVRICENRSIMKSMAMVDFFIENKGTFFPYHYITYGNRHALVRICENGSIMKSMAMVESSSLKIKDALVIIGENGSIMKSMTMVDFFIVNKAKLQLKQQDIINHTKSRKIHDFELGICENGSIMKSMAKVDFFIENKGTFFPYHYITNGKDALWSLSAKMGGTFLPYHYITYGNRHALVRICENRSIMKSMAMVDFFIENKGTFFPYHYITYGKQRHALVVYVKMGR
ncbi:hypothetical protein H6P81_021559 [Aristolochia fimbriata]|uniref:Uncharacterized protein n=1 Tax=Aristolochia fimbriata TaxID=158543 RepID=A0AAV7DU66_ARIFI|nr:hypothetical protein H6P81_021559 [Aristolochia fimbriata]